MGASAETLIARGGRAPAPPSRVSTTNGPPGVPVRAEGVELLGTFDRSGHRATQYLVRRADGQMVQLSPLLYSVLDAMDGARSNDEIASVVGRRIDRAPVAQDVHFLVENKLRPLGLVQGADGSAPASERANPLLALRFRAVVSNPRVTGAIASVFTPLFSAPLVVAFTLGFVAVMGWLLFSHGLAPAAHQALYEPELLLAIFGLTTLSAGFHEMGHAAACRYSGARPGAMGVGLYLVWPAFYTDVTDSYRLDRKGRLRTDLGGIYFNAIFGVAAYGLWLATGAEALLIVVPLQGLLMLRQMIPLVRLDGYHILADLTGVPDLFAHISHILKSMLPTRWGKGDAKHLKPWVRVVVTSWVVIVVPLLVGTLALMVWMLPRLLATAWDSMKLSASAYSNHAADGEIAGAALSVLAIVALAIPALSIVYLIYRVTRRASTKVWRATEGRPVRRTGVVLVAVALIAALAMAWWPSEDRYTPIDPTDHGVLSELVDSGGTTEEILAASASTGAGLTNMTLASADVQAPPVDYQLIDEGDVEQVAAIVQGSFDERSRFLFPLPDPPGMGDNQALVVNTLDGSHMIDLALSLVFVDADEVLNQNGAYAYASCSNCSTIAIAFQVVIIIDGATVVAPENLSVAINAECLRCVTQAIATQLIGTTLDPLTAEEMSELTALWDELESLDARAAEMSLTDVFAEFDRLQTAIEDLLMNEISETPVDENTTQDDDPTAGAVSGGIDGGDPLATTSPTTQPSPSSSPTGDPGTEPSQEPTSDPSPSPSQSP